MNLVKIEHWRCGEPDGITWCFAPEDWAAEQVDEAIRRARDAYQQAVDDYRQAGADAGYPRLDRTGLVGDGALERIGIGSVEREEIEVDDPRDEP